MKTLASACVALLSGGLFGVGMAISGMANPQIVLNFLDVLGDWDPRLIFVMGGALAVFMPAYRWLILPRSAPINNDEFCLSTTTRIDRQLLSGAVIFGLGWGLAGICPGPALASLTMGNPDVWIFVVAMALGLTGTHQWLIRHTH